MVILTRENIIAEFLKSIPEITDFYVQEMEWWEGEEPGLHNLFGNVLNPFLFELLKNKENKHLIKRIFSFLELMAQSPEEYIQEVLVVTILERLGDDSVVYQMALKYMGPLSIKASIEIEKGLGRRS